MRIETERSDGLACLSASTVREYVRAEWQWCGLIWTDNRPVVVNEQ